MLCFHWSDIRTLNPFFVAFEASLRMPPARAFLHGAGMLRLAILRLCTASQGLSVIEGKAVCTIRYTPILNGCIHNLCHAWCLLYFVSGLYCSGVCSTDVGSKFLVTSPFVVLPHILNRIPHGRIRRAEHPCACRTSPPLKIRCFNPHDLPTHTRTVPLTVHMVNIERLGNPAQCSQRAYCLAFRHPSPAANVRPDYECVHK